MIHPRTQRQRTLKERTELYTRVQELRSKGLTVGEVATTLGISRRDVSYWTRVNPPSVERYVPDLKPRPELSYLVGAYLGDGQTAGEQDKKVRFNVADIEFATQLNELVAKVLQTEPVPVKKEYGFYHVNYDAATLYDFLQQPIEAYVPLIEANPGMFLRGFFDAEGYASPQLNHRKRLFSGIAVGVVNTNPEYLNSIQSALSSFRVKPRFVTTHRSGDPMIIRGRTFIRKHDVRHLVITRAKEVGIFHDRIGFGIPDKKSKLDDMIMVKRQLSREEAYDWFVSNYSYVNHKWTKKQS